MQSKVSTVGSKGLGLFKFQTFLLSVAAVLVAMSTMSSVFASTLLKVRFGETAADKTRVVLDINGKVDYLLSGDGQGSGRVIIDVADLSAGVPAQAKAKGLVAKYRFGKQPSGEGRVVLDLRHTAKIDKVFVLPPNKQNKHHRLVVDLKASNKQAFFASLPKRFSEPEAQPKRFTDITQVIEATTKSEPERVRSKVVQVTNASGKPIKVQSTPKEWPVIVIDPGHGGTDPGAQGTLKTQEKTVTLSAALALAEVLKSTGRYKIVLTRASDSRLGLEERSKLARDARPDLFISLHADAHDDRELRGGSVYTLSQEGAERSAREAQSQEDYQVFDLKMSEVAPELGGILFDVAQNETINNSSRFASILAKKLKGVIPLLNNTHRQKDLRVLLAPDVPAVLLELAFISNKKDEKNLNSAVWRKKSMKAVGQSIDLYFEDLEKRKKTASNQPTSSG